MPSLKCYREIALTPFPTSRRGAHRFPQLDVAKALEERQAAGGAEFLGVREILRAPLLAENLRQSLGELVPARVAIVARLAERAHHQVVHPGRHVLPQLRRRL